MPASFFVGNTARDRESKNDASPHARSRFRTFSRTETQPPAFGDTIEIENVQKQPILEKTSFGSGRVIGAGDYRRLGPRVPQSVAPVAVQSDGKVSRTLSKENP